MYNSFKNKKNNLNTRIHCISLFEQIWKSPFPFNCQNMKSQQRKLINSITVNYNEMSKFKKDKIDLSNYRIT